MRRRILTSMVGVVLLAALVLAVPLAIVVVKRDNAKSLLELDRAAERAASELPVDAGSPGVVFELPPPQDPVIEIAVYDGSGRRVAGTGPPGADEIASKPGVETVDGRAGGQVVLARPVTLNGHRVATIRVAEPLSETTDLIRRDLLVLLGVAALAVGLAAIVGSFLAERLARPLRAIRDDAVRLGDGDFAIAAGRTGMAEIDETAHALANTAERLESVLERERTFSANASHQLRTPVTSMRLAVESELQVPRTDSQMVLREVLTDLDRLEATIETLLAVARDIPLDRDAFDTETTASRILSRWEPPLTRGGRSLLVKASEQPPVKVSIAVFDEITDVLIDNAHRHGQGQIVVTVGGTDPGHVTLTVSDAGRMAAEPDSIFHRRHPDAERHGIGLALARSLAEAEGGRLVLTRSEPTTFRLLLPAWH